MSNTDNLWIKLLNNIPGETKLKLLQYQIHKVQKITVKNSRTLHWVKGKTELVAIHQHEFVFTPAPMSFNLRK